jgi:hypothetical protein
LNLALRARANFLHNNLPLQVLRAQAKYFPRLYVTFYNPRYGNFARWALYLEHGPEHIIFQVVGETPNLKQNVTNTRPDQSSRHTENIFMCEVNKQDIEALKNTVAAVPMDNSNSSWDCQEYVLDVLHKLEGRVYRRWRWRWLSASQTIC